MTEQKFVGKLKRKAIENDWNKIRGKGDSSDNNQDLLSHSMDVVQITHNLIDNLELNTDYSEADFLGVAFFHDLHKLDDLGGTNSLENSEVEELLENWDVKGEVLDNFSLQEFTDVLKSIHQYTGSNEARTRVNNDTQLQRLAYVIRLADGIASTVDFTDLYKAGKWRSNREAVERLNQGLKEDYMLGYHQLSEVKPALGNLIHNEVRETVKERGGIPIASRKDGTVYLIPEDFSEKDISEEIREKSIKKYKKNKSSVPSKIRELVFGPKLSIETTIEETREDLQNERGDDDLFDDYRRVAESHNSWDKNSTTEWSLEKGGNELLTVNEENKRYLTNVPSSQKGALIGDLLGNLVSELHEKPNPDTGEELDRLDILELLTETDLDIHNYDVDWSIEKSQLATIIGNYYYQGSDKKAQEIIEEFERKAKKVIEKSDESGALEDIGSYIREVLHLEHSSGVILQEKFEAEIHQENDYEELCITCGNKGEFLFRTTGTGGAYSKTYMARGLAGKATTDDWEPKLCLSCFLDQTLMRALVRSDNSYISDMENTIFLKIYPGRYLGTKQAKILKRRLEDYSSIKGDARDYLEEEDWEEETKFDQLIDDEEYEDVNLDQTISIGSMAGLISSENYFLLAVEDTIDDDSGAEKQITKNWLNAVQRGLLFRYRYNIDVEISNNPEISIDRPYPKTSGVILESPPSQISTVFGDSINFDEVQDNIKGLANLVYSTNYDRAESSNNLNGVYSEFKRSFYPGSRIYRAVERGDGGDSHILDVCNSIDHWKSYITGASNMNRLQNVVDRFKISAKPNASTYMIQDPVRTLVNKIMDADDESREEILDQASGEIYRRVERKWDNPDIYFGYDSDEDVKDLVYEGCAAFYDDVFQDMLDGDKIKLANQKNDILDGFYFIVRRRGASE